jgi:copper transporter 1
MDHGNMGHGGMDHGGMDHGNMCNMNVSLHPLHHLPKAYKSTKTDSRGIQMLFTWDTQNLCIVFKSWRVTSTMSLFWSLLGVMVLTAGYELIREVSRRYEAKVQREIDDMPSKFSPLLLFTLDTHTCLPLLSCDTAESTLLNWVFVTKDDDQEGSSLLASGRSAADAYAKTKTIKAALYAIQVFYSFFIM